MKIWIGRNMVIPATSHVTWKSGLVKTNGNGIVVIPPRIVMWVGVRGGLHILGLDASEYDASYRVPILKGLLELDFLADFRVDAVKRQIEEARNENIRRENRRNVHAFEHAAKELGIKVTVGQQKRIDDLLQHP